MGPIAGRFDTTLDNSVTMRMTRIGVRSSSQLDASVARRVRGYVSGYRPNSLEDHNNVTQ